MSSTYIDGFSQHNCPRYMQFPKQTWNKYDDCIYHWTWQIRTATVFFTAHMMFINLLVNKLCFEFLDQLKQYYIKKPQTHTHTHTHTIRQNIYTVKSSTNVTTINISNIT